MDNILCVGSNSFKVSLYNLKHIEAYSQSLDEHIYSNEIYSNTDCKRYTINIMNHNIPCLNFEKQNK